MVTYSHSQNMTGTAENHSHSLVLQAEYLTRSFETVPLTPSLLQGHLLRVDYRLTEQLERSVPRPSLFIEKWLAIHTHTLLPIPSGICVATLQTAITTHPTSLQYHFPCIRARTLT